MTTPYKRNWETRKRGRTGGGGDRSAEGGGGRSVSDESRNDYYGVPVIHKAHWRWAIIWYFFLGGVSGASYAVANIARLVGGEDNEPIARAGTYLSFAAFLPSPILLILDLGRPERFYNMLRILKLRSPMSVGTWILTAFGFLCSLSTFVQAAQDGLLGRSNPVARGLTAVPVRALAALGVAPGFFLAGYTGVLLAITAVPLWTKNALMMGPLFVSSAMGNACAALGLVLSVSKGTNLRTLRRVESLDAIALACDLGLLLAFHKRLGPVLSRPLTEGSLGRIYKYGVLGVGFSLPAAVRVRALLSGRSPSRLVTAITSCCVLAGGFLFRAVIVLAGHASADDPQATFELASSGDDDIPSGFEPPTG